MSPVVVTARRAKRIGFGNHLLLLTSTHPSLPAFVPLAGEGERRGALSVAVVGQSAPIVGGLATRHRLDATAADVRMDGPHLRNFEPEPQQMPPPVLLGVAIIERGARVQDRVVVDEVHLAGLQGEFQHQLGPLGDLLEMVEHRELGFAHLVSGRGLPRLDIGTDIARRNLRLSIGIDRHPVRRVRQLARLLFAAPVEDIAPIEAFEGFGIFL